MSILAEVRSLLEGGGVSVDQMGADVLVFPIEGQSGRWACTVWEREGMHQLVVRSVFPIEVPEDRRSEAARYLHRAAWGMVIGSFELDLDTGEARTKTSMDLEGLPLVDATLQSLLVTNWAMTDQYLPGLVQVVEGATAEAAIAAVEAEDEEAEPEA